MSWLLILAIVVCLFVAALGFSAVVIGSQADDIEEDMRRRDADILRTIRPTVDHSPGPVGDAEAP